LAICITPRTAHIGTVLIARIHLGQQRGSNARSGVSQIFNEPAVAWVALNLVKVICHMRLCVDEECAAAHRGTSADTKAS
jgi:hypothetical protein